MSLIDPKTGDYKIKNGTASRDPHRGLANAVYIRLTTPLGSYWADKNMGSRLHELRREKDVPRVQVLARQYGEQALQPLVRSSRAKSVTVNTYRPRSGWLLLLISVVTPSGDHVQFQHTIQVGG